MERGYYLIGEYSAHADRYYNQLIAIALETSDGIHEALSRCLHLVTVWPCCVARAEF